MRCADRGQNFGSITFQLSRLLGQYGAAELDVALADANTRGIVHPPSVRQLLEQRRAEAGRPAALRTGAEHRRYATDPDRRQQ